ncbi:type II toxin-antitoxin system RelE/ParE family toxin [Sphingopyxis indica]|uniref:type II toxin-antitoxin system RelE/ParE family toxin n=1 Tax=Sphingopyxis indica TaxID=436663 RepID=UPI0029395479|nr:type II toxin-antitoxin system RelE/ParE family toxin [Sphingopyxis indica]WOF44257.1 type II toxin-antitoxin system RelE/ParE family toxin [Sphingopyxis indica]
MEEPIDNPLPVLYERQAIQFQRTPQFDKWLRTLRDRLARSRIVDRLDRLAFGHVGDAKSVGGGVFELRFAFGPGYRLYYMWKGDKLILLLLGGDKDSQVRDIARAKTLAKEIEDGIEDTSL